MHISETKVLLIEPYFGGSHEQFLEGIMKYVQGDYTLLQLPARKWKMRMQLAAPWFVQKIKEMDEADRFFDIILMSTFMDVAVFRALAAQVRGWNPNTRYFTYFHENQFAYPTVLSKATTHQFAAINFTTALASDSLAFNSNFNRESFLKGCRSYIGKAADIQLSNELHEVERKSLVLYPGIDFEALDMIAKPAEKPDKPLIIWNHRWEHDKNPDEFFQILYRLDGEAIPFRLAVLGQSFRDRPAVFAEARKRLGHVIEHFEFVASKNEYYQILKQGSFVISTSLHEFFGISILEGVRAGCFPLVPDRLSYPELFDKRFRYNEGTLYQVLKDHLARKSTLDRDEYVDMTEKYSWNFQGPRYRQWLKNQEVDKKRLFR
jgi:glycosyltransferase involved in cell wall biosynthesis